VGGPARPARARRTGERAGRRHRGRAAHGPVVFVTARPLERFPSAWAALARGTRVLVVPGEAHGRRAAFSVAGCTGYDVTPAGAGTNPTRRAR